MARIPLEDNFTDVINKAQRGLKISDEQLAKRAEISPDELAAIKAGDPIDAVIRRIARSLRLSPDALEELAHKRFYPVAPVFSRGFTMFNTPHENMTVNSYLIWDSGSRLAAVFDTGADCTAILDTINAERLTLRHIFITHTHDDHIAALPALTAAAPKAEVWSSELEPVDHPGAKTFKENAHFHLGELAIKTLLTCGHSPGMTTFFVTGLSWPLAIVGDSVFSCSMGGSPTHYADQLRNDRDKIFSLPRDSVIAPGHGPLTTLALEKKHNPFFAQ
ncbi:MAG TPA: MBL fold metallo-hydrolase [Rariglobus sp.]|jgi:glyoxylase-like metal-dependent hydrolase (beta-lactamase superfamily II)|nr:MBL fold metallo-hydrolase [Rariglobus sp.]